MLNTIEFGVAARAWLALAALILVWRFVLRSTFVEVFRQRMFELRRELFLEAADGLVKRDRADRLVVQTMNGVLRHADGITFVRMIVGAMVMRSEPDRTREIEQALESSDKDSRLRLQYFQKRVGLEIVRHMAMSSVLFWLLAAIALPILVLLAVVARMLSTMKRRAIVFAGRLGDQVAVRQLEADARAMLPDDVFVT
jgi:hypothetical protein